MSNRFYYKVQEILQKLVFRQDAGSLPAATDAYVARDNSGDLTVNALTGKTVNFAVNAVDEFVVGAASADFKSNDAIGIRRVKAAGGTALVAGDFALSAGFGTTASVGTITGTDTRCRFTVTSAGTGQGANPTITLTFKDGTFTTAPFAAVTLGGGSQLTVASTVSSTATTLVITFNGTPVDAQTYIFEVIVLG